MSASGGYHKLSKFMADENYTIFRQFKILANCDLLYLQAELAQLEDQLSVIQERDRVSGGEQQLYDRNWALLKNRGYNSEQLNKALEIRTKLKEYYESASRYATMIRMPRARRRDIEMLKDWIVRPDLGGGIRFSGEDLSPCARSVYNEMFFDDLMILNDRVGENDLFTRLLAGPVFHLLERFWRCLKKPVPSDSEKQAQESNLFHYSDSHIIGTIDVLGTVIASMIPLVSIVILYCVQNLGARLAILCACTLLFSTSLAVMTKARRIEIFACSAAFASVQVVFVGSTSSSGSL